MLKTKIHYFCHSWRTFSSLSELSWGHKGALNPLSLVQASVLMHFYHSIQAFLHSQPWHFIFFGLPTTPLTQLPLPWICSFKDTQNFSVIHEMPLFVQEMQNICFTIKLGNMRLNKARGQSCLALWYSRMKSWNLFFFLNIYISSLKCVYSITIHNFFSFTHEKTIITDNISHFFFSFAKGYLFTKNRENL